MSDLPPVPTSPDALAVLADGALRGRIAVVTGGGSGIGRATALLLARLGAAVAVVGRRVEALEGTVAVAQAAHPGSDVRGFSCDIREPEDVDALLDSILSTFGRVDLLLNNAGGQFVAPAEQISPNGFRAVTRLNLDATWYVTTQLAKRSMIPNRYGKVVSITMTPRRGMPGMSHSSAARAAVESLTRTWAMEWAQYGVRTAAVAPGIVHTEGWAANYGLDPAAVARAVPLGRLQTADEVAAVVAFLMSAAGDYITGITVTADGGFDIAAPGTAFGTA